MARCDNGVLRSTRPDGRNQFSLNTKPTITIFHHRLVYSLKEHAFGVAGRKMFRQSPPKLYKSFDMTIVGVQSDLKLIGRMNINNYRESLRQNHLQSTVQILQVLAIQFRRI